MQTSRKRSTGSDEGPPGNVQLCQYPGSELWAELGGVSAAAHGYSTQQPADAADGQQANSDDDDFHDAAVPSDAEATVILLRSQLYPDPAAAAAAAAAAKQTRHAKRSRAAPGPSKAAAAAVVAAAAAATAARQLPPIVLKSQLYTVLADRTAVDRDVEDLRRQGRIRLFKLGIGADEFVVLLTSDYLGLINNMSAKHEQLLDQQQQRSQSPASAANATNSSQLQQQTQGMDENRGSSSDQHAAVVATLQSFRDNVIPACHESHINRTQLLQLLQSKPAAAAAHAQHTTAASKLTAATARRPTVQDMERHLLSLEVVCRDSRCFDSYMFTVPGAAAFVKSVLAGRQEMLRLLQRKKYQEILEKELSCVKLRGSCLTPTFHIRDLQGRGLITVTDTTAGKLIRLAKRK